MQSVCDGTGGGNAWPKVGISVVTSSDDVDVGVGGTVTVTLVVNVVKLVASTVRSVRALTASVNALAALSELTIFIALLN